MPKLSIDIPTHFFKFVELVGDLVSHSKQNFRRNLDKNAATIMAHFLEKIDQAAVLGGKYRLHCGFVANDLESGPVTDGKTAIQPHHHNVLLCTPKSIKDYGVTFDVKNGYIFNSAGTRAVSTKLITQIIVAKSLNDANSDSGTWCIDLRLDSSMSGLKFGEYSSEEAAKDALRELIFMLS